MTRLHASVIVRCKDSAAVVGDAISALRAQSCAVEIILVDSGSTDDTLDIAGPLVDQVLELPTARFSYGRALNLGAANASGDIHFALSAHSRPPDAEWIARSLEHHRQEEVAGTSGQVWKPDGRPLLEPVVLDLQAARDHPYWGYSNTGSSWRSDLWRRHPFNEGLEACEDKEWAWRVLRAGYRIVIDPRLAVTQTHRTRAGARALFERSRREARALASFADLPRPALDGAIRQWWNGIPQDSAYPPVFYRLNYFRLAEILGRYAGQRDAIR